MKLFLTSSANRVISFVQPLLPKPADRIRCAFIPTAADIYTEKPWLLADRASLVNLGFNVFDVNLTDHRPDRLNSLLFSADVIFVSGGNTFYLLDKVQKSGAGPILTQLINQGVIYIGSSAGSILAGPDISFVSWHPDWDANSVGLVDTHALSLVNYAVSPHYTESDREILESRLPSINYEIFPLTDQQGLLINGGDVQLVGSGPRIVLHPEYPQLKTYAVVIFHSGQDILVQERSHSSKLGEKYALWGGKIEAGETPDQAIKRELQEELGLSGLHLNYWTEHQFTIDNSTYTLHVYLSPITPQVISAHVYEGKSIVKLSLSQAISSDYFHPGDHTLLLRLHDYLKKVRL